MSTSTNSMDSSDLKSAEKSGEINVTGTQRKITVLLILVVVNITVIMGKELLEMNEMCKSKELEKKALQAEIEKLKLIMENIVLQAKVDKMEEEKGQYEKEKMDKYDSADHQIKNTQNGQQMELMKDKQMKFSSAQRQSNRWDSNACHNDIKISDDKILTVLQKEDMGYRSVFAKYSIHQTSANFSEIFYFEISVINLKEFVLFGFAVKQPMPLDQNIQSRTGTYTFSNYGNFWANGSRKGTTVQFSGGDIVGFGVNLATRQIFFTKNGQHLGVAVFVAASPTDVTFFPFISLLHYNDKIEANFGPNFKFDLSTL
ncbi:hypothetical protein niasHS_015382 [Heterodera schachtii]|uniref:B30.2/SPRY domain-containing protein n=1 Tax=Heterodera schachtii TaxID=97005 RepID=A0ABD2I0H0_HETSC